VAAVAAQLPALLLSAFCLWTPVAWWVGYAFAKAGGRVRSPVNLADSIQRPRATTEFN